MKSALIVVDVQQSFLRRPYWTDAGLPSFIAKLQSLVDGAQARQIPILQVFHVEDAAGAGNPFSRASGLVKTLEPLRIQPTEIFYKSVHSAMFGCNAEGLSLSDWLRRHDIGRLIVTGIRTEQCCETTTRHAADLGFTVTYAIDATLTFPMVSQSGRSYSVADLMERTELVLAGRFADVVRAESVSL